MLMRTVFWEDNQLGVIPMAHEKGKRVHVLGDETRLRLQGAQLTGWEREQAGISYEIITDNMVGYFLRAGKAQKCFVDSDCTAANGDVTNKIGAYMLARAAFDNGGPFYAAVPTSTIDLSPAHGDLIPIEERDSKEVLGLEFHSERVTPKNAKARNIAYDVTPHRLVTAIVIDIRPLMSI